MLQFVYDFLKTSVYANWKFEVHKSHKLSESSSTSGLILLAKRARCTGFTIKDVVLRTPHVLPFGAGERPRIVIRQPPDQSRTPPLKRVCYIKRKKHRTVGPSMIIWCFPIYLLICSLGGHGFVAKTRFFQRLRTRRSSCDDKAT